MKKILSLFILTLVSINAFTQIDDYDIPFIAYWLNGETHQYKVQNISQKWNRDILEKDDTITYKATFQVIDSTETKFKIKWTKQTNIGLGFDLSEETLALLEDFDVVEIIYETNELGEFIGVLNWKEISEKMNVVYETAMENMNEDDEVIDNIETNLMPLLGILNSKEGVETYLVEELQFFHFPFGVEYDTSEDIAYQDLLPNMFGGDPVKANALIKFDSLDYESSYCKFTHTLNIDPKDSKKMITDIFKQMGFNSKEYAKFLKKAVFEINDRNVYEYYYFPGYPIKIETQRDVIVSLPEFNSRGLEKTIIELID